MTGKTSANRVCGRLAALIIILAPLATSGAARAQTPQAAAWPHTITEGGSTVIVYQPQAISWPDHQTLTARAAIAITPHGQKRPVLGTIELSLATRTQGDIVELSNPTLIATHFPALDTQQAAALDTKIRAALPHMQIRQEPVQAILLSLKQFPVANVAVKNDPPTIFYADHPASLVVFDGDPVLVPVRGTVLSFAANTNWDVITDKHAWYLRNNSLWFTAPAATGPYVLTTKLPVALSALPADANFAEVRKHIPAHKPPTGTPIPTIFVSTSPAEIIVTAGAPQFEPVPGTALQRVGNTPSTLFYAPAEKQFYVLLSGRWFSAASLTGLWRFATDTLPPDFAAIADTSPAAAVLPSVPDTIPAQEAVLKAQIPTTATLKRSAAKLVVVYAGAPRFVPIPGTKIEYAVNTGSQVLKIGTKYYACDKGAWFVAPGPMGPWVLADSVPPEIRTIPPSSPLYNVTSVQVYGATPVAVTYGYTSGYTMGFISAGVLVYGTGYYYPPAIIPGPVPVYYPYPYTYASNVWYNSSTSAWARGGTIYGPYGAASGGRYYNASTGGWAQGGAIYGPYGGAGAWSYYNPHTDTYAHGSAAWGNGSGTANASFYNPRYGVSGSTTQNANPYSRWGSSTVSGPHQTVNTQSRGNAQGAVGSFSSSSGAQGAGYHNRVNGSRGGAAQGANGDVYAGRDGNVYRHDDSGWSKWNNGGWNPVQPPGNTSGNANRSNTTGSTNANRKSTNNLGASRNSGSGRSTVDPTSYQQLQQDRLGRQAGGWQSGRWQSGGGRFGGDGGGGFRGGGRLRQ